MLMSMSGRFGDILAMMANLTDEECELVLFPSKCSGFNMTEKAAKAITRLLESQEYVKNVRHANKPEGMNLDKWRQHYKEGLNLSDMMADYLNKPRVSTTKPWLSVRSKNEVSRIIFCRSARYNNNGFPWKDLCKKYHKEAVFLGHKYEHDYFCKQVGTVQYLATADLLEAAEVIAGCELFIGNQTCLRWVAEGLKVPVCVEQIDYSCNTHWERPGATYGDPETGRLNDLVVG